MAKISSETGSSGTSVLKKLRDAVGGGGLRQYGMMIALGLLVLLFQFLTNGLFLQPRNVTSLLVQNGYVLILAIGMVMVIIAGHIDLSVGSVCAFVGATVATSMYSWHFPWPAAILLGLALGILVGIWQGFWVAYVGIPAFIVTLAGMLLFRGLDLMILNAQSIPVPEAFQKIANGYLPEVGPNTGYHNITLLLSILAVVAMVWFEFRRRADLKQHEMPLPSMVGSVIKLVVLGALIMIFGMLLASYRGVPVVGLILLALVIAYTFVTQQTVTGRRIYAVGGNRHAAGLSGVDTKKIDFFVMVNMSFLAAIAGMVFTAYLNAANPKDGQNFELDAIAAVFIGGAAVAGGVGTVAGSMIGGLVMGVLNLGLANMSVDSNWIQIIKGLVLLGAVAFDVISKLRGKSSFIDMIIRAVGGGRGGSAETGPALGLPATGSETGETPVKGDGATVNTVSGFKRINGASAGATRRKRETAGR
ncbi:multiple monosaccharide ABC transporter permease [Raineyella sp. LH-20]|uniref:multiple monosaccharide ABC transporter permease n=1 Tax=Raineyella sp. LH-20 TaxID=3081204 RepID=UPI002953C081|nr:multiple monosaccharide ABC transporter permease [Raineyella sp. LH-20]WOP17726.1 multiple monosaccharide ABC transporter permease [Raineyella sp. LH-20]